MAQQTALPLRRLPFVPLSIHDELGLAFDVLHCSLQNPIAGRRLYDSWEALYMDHANSPWRSVFILLHGSPDVARLLHNFIESGLFASWNDKEIQRFFSEIRGFCWVPDVVFLALSQIMVPNLTLRNGQNTHDIHAWIDDLIEGPLMINANQRYIHDWTKLQTRDSYLKLARYNQFTPYPDMWDFSPPMTSRFFLTKSAFNQKKYSKGRNGCMHPVLLTWLGIVNLICIVIVGPRKTLEITKFGGGRRVIKHLIVSLEHLSAENLYTHLGKTSAQWTQLLARLPTLVDKLFPSETGFDLLPKSCDDLIDERGILSHRNSEILWADPARSRKLGDWVVEHLFKCGNWPVVFDILGMDKVGKLEWAGGLHYDISDGAPLASERQQAPMTAEHRRREVLAPLQEAVKAVAARVEEGQTRVDAHAAAARPRADLLAGLRQGFLPPDLHEKVSSYVETERKEISSKMTILQNAVDALRRRETKLDGGRAPIADDKMAIFQNALDALGRREAKRYDASDHPMILEARRRMEQEHSDWQQEHEELQRNLENARDTLRQALEELDSATKNFTDHPPEVAQSAFNQDIIDLVSSSSDDHPDEVDSDWQKVHDELQRNLENARDAHRQALEELDSATKNFTYHPPEVAKSAFNQGIIDLMSSSSSDPDEVEGVGLDLTIKHSATHLPEDACGASNHDDIDLVLDEDEGIEGDDERAAKEAEISQQMDVDL